LRHYIIDGNNLIGKIPELEKFHKKDKQLSREKLALYLQRYFHNPNVKISLHFDGFPKDEIKFTSGTVSYSKNLSADELIKKEIEQSKNPRNLVIVSSDLSIARYAQKCGCTVLSAEKFAKQIITAPPEEEEKRRIKELDNPDEFKKLFGI
jgi:predicted RNA-binding protein with PIN domain